MAKKLVVLFFFLSFSVLVDAQAQIIEQLDDYWKARMENSTKANLEAYNPDPEEVTAQLNAVVHRYVQVQFGFQDEMRLNIIIAKFLLKVY